MTGVGIAPRPVQQPIPIWFGGASPAAFRRAGRLADGWLPMMQPGPKLDEALGYVAEGAAEAGRDPGLIAMEGRLDWRGDLDDLVRRVGTGDRPVPPISPSTQCMPAWPRWTTIWRSWTR